jgi:RNA polymerase sigma-70 factor (TIGR02952 family)
LLTILTQAQIIDQIGSSAAQAFTDLYEQYLPKVYRYISYRITDTHMAEDLTSAVFEKALTKFKSYSSEKASFSTWIFTIARNTLTDHYRVVHRQQTTSLDNLAQATDPGTSPAEESEREEEIRMLNSCIAQLSPNEQEIISLKFGSEMTNRQIAKMLALTESNVGIIIYRAVRKLRDSFRGKQNG